MCDGIHRATAKASRWETLISKSIQLTSRSNASGQDRYITHNPSPLTLAGSWQEEVRATGSKPLPDADAAAELSASPVAAASLALLEFLLATCCEVAAVKL